jgi:hypothetical protein
MLDPLLFRWLMRRRSGFPPNRFLAKVDAIKVGSPFSVNTFQGPQVSQLQYDRIMEHIQSFVFAPPLSRCPAVSS